MACSILIMIALGESLFDKSKKNDAPVWLLAIPISMFLISQAILDVLFARYTLDPKKRLFNFLDNSSKKLWVGGHLFASIIYSGMLFYWLWIMHSNENNREGQRED